MSYLLAKDTVNGAEGKIFVTIDGKNMEVACMRNIKTNAEIQSNDMQRHRHPDDPEQKQRRQVDRHWKYLLRYQSVYQYGTAVHPDGRYAGV